MSATGRCWVIEIPDAVYAQLGESLARLCDAVEAMGRGDLIDETLRSYLEGYRERMAAAVVVVRRAPRFSRRKRVKRDW